MIILNSKSPALISRSNRAAGFGSGGATGGKLLKAGQTGAFQYKIMLGSEYLCVPGGTGSLYPKLISSPADSDNSVCTVEKSDDKIILFR